MDMTDYKVSEYWDMLDKTAILINTSYYESFCCALFEAKAKGVATIHKEDLQGAGIHRLSEVQVDYKAEAYCDEIRYLINENLCEVYGVKNREYVEKYATLKKMRDSIAKIYKEI